MTDLAQSITTEEIAAATGLPIVAMNARPWEYHTSHAMHRLGIKLTDGTELDMLFKDLSPQNQLEEARRTRPDFLYDPKREIEVYRDMLATAGLDTPMCYGAVIDEARQPPRYWLFIECVAGYSLRLSEWKHYPRAAKWLARLHQMRPATLPLSLLVYTGTYYKRWMKRALANEPRLAPISRRYDELLARLMALPTTFIHGEFYAANVMVDGRRIRPIDWETTAVGPAMMDLAALCAGKIDDAQRAELIGAYGHGNVKGLDECRLQLAIQWLGWSREWKPPADQAQDWLNEALTLASKLGIT